MKVRKEIMLSILRGDEVGDMFPMNIEGTEVDIYQGDICSSMQISVELLVFTLLGIDSH